MRFGSWMILLTATALIAGTGACLALGNAGAADKQAGAPVASHATPVAAASPTGRDLYPFGAPTGSSDFTVPPPPEEPTLVPTIGTKTTQRLYGANPFEEAVSITQHIWLAARPANGPVKNNNVPDRPWGLTLLTPDDPLTAITATPLIHFPTMRRSST
jgi:hypothetical protein